MTIGTGTESLSTKPYPGSSSSTSSSAGRSESENEVDNGKAASPIERKLRISEFGEGGQCKW